MSRRLITQFGIGLIVAAISFASAGATSHAETPAPIAQIPLDGAAYTGALSPDGSRLYVSADVLDADGQTLPGLLDVIDTGTNTVTARIPLGKWPGFPIVSRNGSRVYVPNVESGTVSVIDATSNAVVETIEVGGEPYRQALMPSGRTLFVSNRDGGDLIVIDTQTNSIKKRIALGGDVDALVLSANARHLYITNIDLDRFDVLDTKTNKIVAQVKIPGRPMRPTPTPNGRFVIVPTWESDQAFILDARSFAKVDSVKVGRRQAPAAVTANSQSAWIGSLESDTVSEIRMPKPGKRQASVIRTVPGVPHSFHLLLNADDSTLFVANRLADTISVICTKNGSVPQTIPTKGHPRWLVGGPALYVVEESGLVEVFPAAALGTGVCA
jgi:YVTN family beta-propeller protein